MKTNQLEIRQRLAEVREFAEAKIAAGNEPPWAWYQYMKLVEAVHAIEDGMEATTTKEAGSLRLASLEGKRLPPADSAGSQDSAQSHPHPKPPSLPM